MLTATTGYSTTQSTTINESIRKQQNTHIFILRLYDGRLAIGQASNVGRRIASINSGLHPSLPKSLMVKEVLGEAWLTNEWYRFGASSLANDLLMQYQKQLTGKYQSAAYFSID